MAPQSPPACDVFGKYTVSSRLPPEAIQVIAYIFRLHRGAPRSAGPENKKVYLHYPLTTTLAHDKVARVAAAHIRAKVGAHGLYYGGKRLA